jgi:hypothetical protein
MKALNHLIKSDCLKTAPAVANLNSEPFLQIHERGTTSSLPISPDARAGGNGISLSTISKQGVY